MKKNFLIILFLLSNVFSSDLLSRKRHGMRFQDKKDQQQDDGNFHFDCTVDGENYSDEEINFRKEVLKELKKRNKEKAQRQFIQEKQTFQDTPQFTTYVHAKREDPLKLQEEARKREVLHQNLHRFPVKRYSMSAQTRSYVNSLGIKSYDYLKFKGLHSQHKDHEQCIQLMEDASDLYHQHREVKECTDLTIEIADSAYEQNKKNNFLMTKKLIKIGKCVLLFSKGVVFGGFNKIICTVTNPIGTVTDFVFATPRMALLLVEVAECAFEMTKYNLGYVPSEEYLQKLNNFNQFYDNIKKCLTDLPAEDIAEKLGYIVGDIALDLIITKKVTVPALSLSKNLIKKVPKRLEKFGDFGKETAKIIGTVSENGKPSVQKSLQVIKNNPSIISEEKSIAKAIEKNINFIKEKNFIELQLKPVAENQTLQKCINQLYRRNAIIGSGSTADAIRHELNTKELINGKSHVKKGLERITNLKNIIKNENLNQSDNSIAQLLIKDLEDALNGK